MRVGRVRGQLYKASCKRRLGVSWASAGRPSEDGGRGRRFLTVCERLYSLRAFTIAGPAILSVVSLRFLLSVYPPYRERGSDCSVGNASPRHSAKRRQNSLQYAYWFSY